MNKYKDSMKDSFNLQTFVSVRIVAKAILFCKSQGIEIRGASDLGRQCIGAIAEQNTMELSVQQSLDVLQAHGFSMGQFQRRGDGVRKQLMIEDIAEKNKVFQERAEEITNYIEDLKKG